VTPVGDLAAETSVVKKSGGITRKIKNVESQLKGELKKR